MNCEISELKIILTKKWTCKMTANKILQFGRSILPYNVERYRRINIYRQLLPCDLLRPVSDGLVLIRIFGRPFLRLYQRSSTINQSSENSDVILSDNDIEIIKRHTLACKVESNGAIPESHAADPNYPTIENPTENSTKTLLKPYDVYDSRLVPSQTTILAKTIEKIL